MMSIVSQNYKKMRCEFFKPLCACVLPDGMDIALFEFYNCSRGCKDRFLKSRAFLVGAAEKNIGMFIFYLGDLWFYFNSKHCFF